MSFNGWNLYTVSQKTSHLWLAIILTQCERIWIFFGRNVVSKVNSQKMLYYATSNNLCFCTTWQNANTKIAFFSLKCYLYLCIARIQPVVAWFLQSFWLTTHTHAAVWLPKSCNQCVQLVAVWGGARFINEVESAAEVGLCCTHNAPVRCLLGFLCRKVVQKH